jgi:ABC-2 type transport system ATP-binding protein
MDAILEIKNLKKHYPGVKAVDGIHLSIERGICFGLLGPNGAGKTTTIEVIEGLLEPTAGDILYKNEHRHAAFYQEIGIQFQDTELPQFLTVGETLDTFRSLYNRHAELEYLVSACHLEDIWDRDNRKISGGQRQRLLLALALANDPELIFLDEPTTGLDPQARRHVWDIVTRIKRQNKTIVLTTHYMEEAQILCDIIAIIDQGKIIAYGTPADLLEKYCKGASVLLPFGVKEDLLQDFPCPWYKVEEQIEIQTDNMNGCIEALVKRNIDLSGMTVRSQNLDDLFLKLTGTQLRM